MEELEQYFLWCREAVDDPALLAELGAIKGDVDAIRDRFYRELSFGTGGLRGVIGAGTNRMNIYTVRKATQGLCNVLLAKKELPQVAVSYDSRINSDLFAREAAVVFAANGIKVWLYPTLMPTPALSFAVRALSCDAGIMVTASHNPAKYNGYKVYGADGCQITLEDAERITEAIARVDLFRGVRKGDFAALQADGLICMIPDSLTEAYLDAVQAQSVDPTVASEADLSVVYSPLNGTGNLPVRAILSRIGVKKVAVVPEQELPDGTFRTCPFPNPEIPEALELGLRLCETVKPDLLLATDPDCDRVGIAVPDREGKYQLITGNEVGALLLSYLCQRRLALGKMPDRPVAIKTIVTTELAARIAEDYGVTLIDVLTGFKFIGEQIGLLEQAGETDRFILGFEESYGYLAGSYVRDKDGVVASMLICEMAAYYKKNGISLLEALQALYLQYGVYRHRLESFTCEGASGMALMAEKMAALRSQPPAEVAGAAVTRFTDYLAGDTGLPPADVLSFFLADGGSVVIRPSGTEPKIKVYYTATAATVAEADSRIDTLQAAFTGLLGF